MKDLRRVVAGIVIGSFSVAALLGIIALLSGDFGDTQARVLGTTVVVGLESLAVLCYLATFGRPFAAVGALGFLTSLAPFAIALWLVWADESGTSDWPWRAVGIGVTVAASLAQACLLLALAWSRRTAAVTLATLAAITVVAAMIIVAIIDGSDLGAGYWRLFGIVAILDVLGTIVTGAWGLFGRDAGVNAERTEPTRSTGSPLSPAVEARLTHEARRRGMTPDDLVTAALDHLPS